MRLCRELYVGESLKKKRERIIGRIRRGQYPLRLYLLTLPRGGGQLECYPGALLKQPLFGEEDSLLVGVAADQGEALELIQSITEQVYKETGGADIRAWIMEKEQV